MLRRPHAFCACIVNTGPRGLNFTPGDTMPHRGVHDLGGLPGDEAVDRTEHESHPFEKRVNALLRLLSHPDRKVMRVDELRRGIESLNETEYAGYTYYERWTESIRRILVEKGMLDEAALAKKIEEVRNRPPE